MQLPSLLLQAALSIISNYFNDNIIIIPLHYTCLINWKVKRKHYFIILHKYLKGKNGDLFPYRLQLGE